MKFEEEKPQEDFELKQKRDQFMQMVKKQESIELLMTCIITSKGDKLKNMMSKVRPDPLAVIKTKKLNMRCPITIIDKIHDLIGL
jgi:hypothetical protein